MGIPLYFKTIYDEFPDIVVSYINNSNSNYLFLDLNCAIHPCVAKIVKDKYEEKNKELYEKRMIVEIINYIEKLVTLVSPETLFIAIDGVAPKAKIIQQRQRRFKSVKDKKYIRDLKNQLDIEIINDDYDTNSISPGTIFMDKLNNAINDFISQKKNYNIIFSNSNVPGEGEHKITEYIRKNKTLFDDKNIIIYGLDADLIMLSMALRIKNVYLLREEIEYNKKSKSNFGEKYLFLNINHLKRCIIEKMSNEYKTIDNTININNNFVDDYVFICLLLGNDFLPHMPSISLKNNGLDTLIKEYLLAYYKLNTHLIVNNKINQSFLMYLFNKLSDIEDSSLLEYSNKRKKFKPEYINMNDVNDEFSKRMLLKNFYPLLNQEKEKYINIGSKGWKARYYSKLFNASSNEEVDDICYNYLETLKWTFDYYYNGCPSFHHSYNYYHPPTIKDLYKYFKNNPSFDINKITFKKGVPVSPLVQLLSILPVESKKLLPDKIQDLMTSNKSPIVYYYPIDFEYDTYYKNYFWQCPPLLPVIDQNKIKDAILSVKLTTKDKKRFTKQKIIIVNKL